MMAAVEGRAMRRSPAEPAATSCRGAWKRLRSLPTGRIAASGTCLLTDVSRNGTVDPGDGGHLENPVLAGSCAVRAIGVQPTCLYPAWPRNLRENRHNRRASY